MKKKGFTLIELLAVIVVLAIIALIATPMILNTIDESRQGAAKSSGYGYINSLETSLASYMLRNNGVSYSAGKYDISKLNTDLDVTIKGEKPSEGKVCVASNGTVTKASLKVNGYIVSYDGKEVKNTDLKEVEDITCDGASTDDTTGSDEVVTEGPTQEVASNGETYKAIVYLDPTDLTKTCDASNSVSTTGTKEGCMKWYAYGDDGINYTMILDHDTTVSVAYNSNVSITDGMNEIADALTSDTSTWTSELNPRLITADEVAQITGATERLSWTSDKTYANTPVIGTSISWFYLDGASGSDVTWHTQIATSQGASKYAWLYDYTDGCASYGCNVENSSNKGYWTSTPVTGFASGVWRVLRRGSLGNYNIDGTNYGGVRPVITVSKNIIK